MRHRSGKHDIDLNPSSTDVFGAHNHSKQSVGTHRAERNLHNGVWIRIICILIFVTFSVLIVARISEVHVDSVLNPRNKLSEIEKHILHAPAPSFVTIVMPRLERTMKGFVIFIFCCIFEMEHFAFQPLYYLLYPAL